MSGISSIFRKAKRIVGLKSFARMVICLLEEMVLRGALQLSASTSGLVSGLFMVQLLSSPMTIMT